METRTQRLKERLLAAPFEVCPERAVLWTEAMRASEGQAQVVRNALALKHLLENMSVTIRDEELIVGSRTSKKRGSPLFPEVKSFSIETQLDSYATRPIQPYRVSPEDRKAIKAALPYWRGKSAWDLAFKLMPRDLQADVFKLVFTVEAEFANGIGHFIVGNPKLLSLGLVGIREEAEKRLAHEKAPGSDEQRDFWQAVIICAEAAVHFAGRYATEAKRLAARESEPRRQEELTRIAEVCERVPARPPLTFREALQAVWFNQLICQLECGGFAHSPGRLDQLLFPFYEHDVMTGRLTAETAQELIECLYVKMSEVVNVLDTALLPVTSGPPIAQSLTIGGTDENGQDAANELTRLFLDAHDSIRAVSPNLAVRFHEHTPPEFTRRVCEAIRRGTMMALFNDQVIVPAMTAQGIPLKEARGYALVGCVEPAAPGRTFGSTDSNLVNIAKCLELALNNGDGADLLAGNYIARKLGKYFRAGGVTRAPKSNGNRANVMMLVRYGLAMGRRTKVSKLGLYRFLRGKGIGVRSGDPKSFTGMADVFHAYEQQVSFFVRRMAEAMAYCDQAHARMKPTPFISSCIDDCIQNGKDVTGGGARYNFTGPQAVGLADAADSLAALQTLVFERKKVSMTELLLALEKNFRDAEPLRQMLLSKAPKYGNDNDAADQLAREAAAIYCREVGRHPNFRGGKFQPGIYSMSSHLVFGLLTGATPDGRRQGESLAAGVSPGRGRELKGPAAVMRSVAKVDARLIGNGSVLNMTFHPQLIKGDTGLQKFADLNRAYFKLGGFQVQHNILDAETLREAQKHPDQYRGLVVRVAGYSALFTELDRATQEDIIKRTAHGCD